MEKILGHALQPASRYLVPRQPLLVAPKRYETSVQKLKQVRIEWVTVFSDLARQIESGSQLKWPYLIPDRLRNPDTSRQGLTMVAAINQQARSGASFPRRLLPPGFGRLAVALFWPGFRFF
jgi:hypothetical protein